MEPVEPSTTRRRGRDGGGLTALSTGHLEKRASHGTCAHGSGDSLDAARGTFSREPRERAVARSRGSRLNGARPIKTRAFFACNVSDTCNTKYQSSLIRRQSPMNAKARVPPVVSRLGGSSSAKGTKC